VLIVIYRDRKTEKIKSHQKLPEQWTEEEANERSQKFNSKESGVFAEIMCVAENGVLEYFLTALDKKERYTKETIEDALSAIRDAENAILSLQVAEKE
jgi:hypothetical protein